jgi:uncharacterized protein (DUF849 family)
MGPMWMPGDCTPEQRLPVTWEEQTQIAVDCFNAGATILHIHVRDPKTGHISKNFKEYADQIGRLRQAARRPFASVSDSARAQLTDPAFSLACASQNFGATTPIAGWIP